MVLWSAFERKSPKAARKEDFLLRFSLLSSLPEISLFQGAMFAPNIDRDFIRSDYKILSWKEDQSSMEPQVVAIAGRYACEPPERLWRVQYEGNNLRSRGKADFTSAKSFRRAVESHLEWRNPAPSPFISTFDNQRHAVNWANKLMENRNYDSVLLHEIDATKLGPVFRVENLVSRLRVQPKLEPSVYEDEYFVLGQIPKQSICSTRAYNNVRLEDHGYADEDDDQDWYFDDEEFDPDSFDDEYYDYDEVDLDSSDWYGEAGEIEDDPYEEFYDYEAWPEDLDPDSCDDYYDDDEEDPDYWPEEIDPDCWPEEVDPEYYG